MNYATEITLPGVSAEDAEGKLVASFERMQGLKHLLLLIGTTMAQKESVRTAELQKTSTSLFSPYDLMGVKPDTFIRCSFKFAKPQLKLKSSLS